MLLYYNRPTYLLSPCIIFMRYLQTKPPLEKGKCEEETRNVGAPGAHEILGLKLEREILNFRMMAVHVPSPALCGKRLCPAIACRRGSWLKVFSYQVLSFYVQPWDQSPSTPSYFDSLRLDFTCVFVTFSVRLYLLL